MRFAPRLGRVRPYLSRLLCLALLMAVPAAEAQLADPIPDPIIPGDVSVELGLVADGMAAPNYLTHAGDGTDRLFVVDQAGTVELIKNGVRTAQPFLDLSGRLVELGLFGTQDPFGDFDERGLLGLAFHPGFADPGSAGYRKLYTYSSEPGSDHTFPGGPNHVSVIAEWQVDQANPDQVDPTTRREVLTLDQPQFNHNGGMVAFGPDGYLYVSLGDGGAGDDQGTGHSATGNGQDPSNLLGSILRIDPLDPAANPGSADPLSANGRYRIPADNPFLGDPNPGTSVDETRDEIFAYGFRNPFRFSFDVDPATNQITANTTGQLIVGDVGQNHIEEVDIVTAGGNYGWNTKEGTFLFDPNGGSSGFVTADSPGSPADLIDPVLQYDHDEGLSVLGGFVYRGSAIPDLQGMYVFADFSTSFFEPRGRLFYADLDTGEIRELLPGLELFIKGLGRDAAGELYVLAGPNLGPFGDHGNVYRLVIPEPTAGVLMLAGAAALQRRRRGGRC